MKNPVTELILWILALQYSCAAATSWSWKQLITRDRRQTTTPGYPACPDPGIPENGYRIGTVFYQGHSLTFGCNTGYTLIGSEILHCRYGSYDIYWDAPTPQCIPERVSIQLQLSSTDPCGPPPQATSFSFVADYVVGALVEYRCMNGYVQQSGSEELACVQNDWEGESLRCRRLGRCTDYGSTQIQNGYRTIEGTTEGDMVAFGCNDGYDLIGNRQLTCGSNGRWIGAWPICARAAAECGDPGTPAMGGRMLTGTTEGSTVDYSCQFEGYVLRGNVRRTCQQSGRWSGNLPVCERVSCPRPREPEQGSVRFPARKYGTTLSYHCDAGLVLYGARSAVCNADGQWSRQPPTCRQVVCGALRHPRNGRVSVPSRSYGSRATYSCIRGYALVGAQTRVCRANGEWSHSIPSCRSGTCGSLRNPQNGRVSYSSRNINSVAAYHCNHGYRISGTWRRVCRADGWTGTEPVCNPVMCPMLSTPRNGQVAMTNENFYTSIATYSCDFGFRMLGTSTRQCQPTGIWTETPPGCYEVNCGPLKNVHNGVTQFSSTGLGSEATYVCNSGFRLAFGDRIRTCIIEGYWSGTEPCCIKLEIMCEQLEDPENGRVIQPTRIAGAVADYECSQGFTLVGSETRTCEPSGKWSGEAPICIMAVTCPDLENPGNGLVDVSGNQPGDTAVYSCDDGFTLDGVDTRTCGEDGEWSGSEPTCVVAVTCPNLENPGNGTVDVSGNQPGDTAVYSCDDGFTLDGVDTRTCGENGQWSGSEPTCVAIECPVLDDPANGQVDLPSTTVGSTATYSCDGGYRLMGEETRTCLDDGEWSGTAPFCRRVDCGDLDDPENGEVSLTGTTFGSNATYSCNDGYFLEGESSRVCQSDGNWSGEAPTCERVMSCPDLENPGNGTVDVSGNQPGDTAVYSCNDGFTLDGVDMRTCGENGQWSGSEPTCILVVTCPSLENPVNGTVDVSGNQTGDTAVYSCDFGFIPDGEATRTCGEDGQWSGSEPTCILFLCPALDPPQNGTLILTDETFNNSQALYMCEIGFQLVGDGMRVCGPGGWTGSDPACRILCPNLTAPTNGVVDVPLQFFGGVATYNCTSPYTLVGNFMRLCMSNGEWEGEAPTCELICPDLENPDNGIVDVSGNQPGDTAVYTCNDGFTLDEVDTRTCGQDGEWSGSEPTCVVICPDLENPDNGIVDVSGNQPGDTAVYTCNDGFTLDGENRTCGQDGKWSGSEPTCVVVVTCPNLENPGNGTVDVSGNQPGDTAVYSCNDGFTLDGEDTRTCGQDGKWSGSEPTCVVVVTCPNLENPGNGTVDVSGNQPGDTAVYSCNDGFTLDGEDTRTCGQDGQWSGSEPICVVVLCPILTSPAGGNVLVDMQTVTGTAIYMCDEGLTRIGPLIRRCMPNGEWSDEAPTCELIECPVLENPENGSVVLEGNTPGSMATYTCTGDFTLIGSDTRVCGIDGVWDGTAPTCEIVLCPILIPPANGGVVVDMQTVTGTAIYMCDDGFTRIGPLIRRCMPNGEWSDEAPTCEPDEDVLCPILIPPANGGVVVDMQTVTGTAIYMCDDGFTRIGPLIRRCMPNGEWSDEAPTCEPEEAVLCPILIPPANGGVLVDMQTVTGTAIYMCDDGFERIGPLIRRCMPNGEWSDEAPTCERCCPDLVDPPNGMVDQRGKTPGSMAAYSCDALFRVEPMESSVRVCMENGQWSGQEPTCEFEADVTCPFLDDPMDGTVLFPVDRRPTDRATYRCNDGFVRVGDLIRECQENGMWTGEAPICRLEDCGNLPNPLNGVVEAPVTTFGSVARYSCNNGFALQGNNGDDTRTCTDTGIWSGEEPTCQFSGGVIDCGDPGEPDNGFSLLSTTTVGSMVEHGCDESYMLQSTVSQIRRCESNGQWTGELPQCIPVICPNLQSPENGVVDNPVIPRFTSQATYMCNQGFTRVGVLARTCLSNGTWSGEEPVCIPIECPVLENPPNGMVVVSGLTVGSNATYTCLLGFTLIGVMTRECQLNAEWSDQEPTCERRCRDLETPANGRRVGNNFTVGMRIYFVCADGYETQDQQVLLCQDDNNTWDFDPPVCTAASGSCTGTGQVMDQFGRRCTCANGQFESCSRFRRDWNTLSDEEKQTYISAVLTVATDPQYQPLYNQLLQIYDDSSDTPVQSTAPETSQFFPWHRYFLLEYEDLLRLVNSSITIPYWDWTLLPTDPYSSPVFDPVTGFGNSSNSITTCVTSGPFREEVFQVTPSAGGDCLRRQYEDSMYPTRIRIENNLFSVSAENFDDVHMFLQIAIHLNVRCFVGGDLCTLQDATNDPLYLLHLSRIDLILDEWQSIDSARASVRYENDNTELVMNLDGDLTVSDFSSNRDLPFGVSVLYAPLQPLLLSAPLIGSGSNSTRAITIQSDDPGARARQPDADKRHCISESLINQLLSLTQDREFLHRICSRYDG